MPKRSNEFLSAQRSAKKKPRGKPFAKGNVYRIKPGTILNPGGKTRKVSNAYILWLSLEDELGKANADKIAEVVGGLALSGDASAYKEMRQATEGDKVFTGDLSKATDEELERIANGEDPAHVITGESGGVVDASTTQGPEGSSPDPTPPTLDSV